MAEDIRLHIGGEEPREGWSIFNVKPGPGVDYVGHCTDLSTLADNSCCDVYTSHVLEHLGYDGELQKAVKELRRVLKPGGRLRISVPDLEILCKLFLHPANTPEGRFQVMRMIYGGRTDPYDVHYVGFCFEMMNGLLLPAGFHNLRRVQEFKLFNDTSSLRFGDQLISLNVEAWKPAV